MPAWRVTNALLLVSDSRCAILPVQVCVSLSASHPEPGKAGIQRPAQGLKEGRVKAEGRQKRVGGGKGRRPRGQTGLSMVGGRIQHLGRIQSPSPIQSAPIQAAWFCTSDFSGTGPSHPMGVAEAYPGVRGKYSLSWGDLGIAQVRIALKER